MSTMGEERNGPQHRADVPTKADISSGQAAGAAHHVATHGIPPRGHGELLTIQYARALAAVLVVINHLGPQFIRMGFTPSMWDGLAGGVDIFFVISGLIMWVTTCDRVVSPFDFFLRRLTRIVPLYWIVTTFSVIMIVVAPKILQTARLDVWHIVASYAFIAWKHPATGHWEPVVIPGWTLNYEMFFYVVFAISLALRRPARMLLVAAIFLLFIVAGAVLGVSDNSRLSFYTAPITLEFVYGIILGELYVSTPLLDRIGRRSGLALAGLGLLLLLLGPDMLPGWPRFIVSGLPALMIVAGLLSLDAAAAVGQNRNLLLLGNASYSLYLIHPIILSGISQAWRKAHLDQTPLGLLAFSIVALSLCCIISVMAFQYIEVPLIGYFRRLRKPLA